MADALADRKIVIIGGSSGIGFAIARGALEAGARVVIASSRRASVEAALTKLTSAKASGTTIDVADESSVSAFFDGVGAFDHLAYTAGDWTAAGSGPIGDLDLAAANAIFRIRFWGALACVKHALKRLDGAGSITLTDGIVAHRPQKFQALSSAMTGAIEHLAQALAVDLAPVRVNAVCPGMVATEVWDRLPPAQREERLVRRTARQPLPRPGAPAEVAEAYLHLMRASFTTGQVLRVDGGLSLI